MLHGQRNAFDAGAKADARRGTSAQLLDEPIVAPAAADGILRAQAVGLDLKDGLGVVVQPTHDAIVHLIGAIQLIQVCAQTGEVVGAIVA